jgi:hypothetical protein
LELADLLAVAVYEHLPVPLGDVPLSILLVLGDIQRGIVLLLGYCRRGILLSLGHRLTPPGLTSRTSD